LASDLASSLSYFSRLASHPPTGGWQQIPQKSLTFDPSKAYVAIVTSDGDNLAYDFGFLKYMLDARVAFCLAPNRTTRDCPPVSWTFSPRLPEFAPVWLEYYYAQAKATGADSFLFGPSGFGYLYPSLLSFENQAKFAQLTCDRATELDVSATVWSENTMWDNLPGRTEQMAFYSGSQIRGVVTELWNAPAVVGNVTVVAADVKGYDPCVSFRCPLCPTQNLLQSVPPFP
jgi:hypothetical protein